MGHIFKEGDKVYLYTLGWGTIIELNSFFIVIKFDITDDNRHIGGGLIDLISFTEYTLEGFSQERPEELPKPGDIVWVRDMEYDNWMITYFRRFNSFDDAKLRYGCNPRNSADSTSIYYYKYLTTKNPYANEQ
jgi:hypothetical protein